MASEDDSHVESLPRTARAVALLALYAGIAGWVFYEQSTSWPHEGSGLAFVQLFLCPGIAFQSCVVFYARVTGRALARRVLTRFVTVPLGLVIGAALGEWASGIAMHDFERVYTPFAMQVGANLVEPCSGAAKYLSIPAVAAYNERVGRKPTASLAHDSKRFVVSFSGGSFDMDGSTIYFDSGAGKWRKFHNDSKTAAAEFEKLTSGLAACKLHSVPVPQ